MKKYKPPVFARLILNRMTFYNRQFGTAGDIEEEYLYYRNRFGRITAWFWYWFQTIQLVFHYLYLLFYWSNTMFINYFKTAIRNILKTKAFTAINFSGLVLGFTSCLLIFLYVQNELSYESFHEKKDRIYHVYEDIRTSAGTSRLFASIAGPCGPALEKDYPEIVNAVRFYFRRNVEVVYKDKMFYEREMLFTDPDVFSTFTFPFLSGDPATALTDGNSIVISRMASIKYFGTEDPIGKNISVNGQDFTVSGVIENIPHNSHLRFDFLGSLNRYDDWDQIYNWYATMFRTYIEVAENVNSEELSDKIRMIAHNYEGAQYDQWGEKWLHHIQPLEDVYLSTKIPLSGMAGSKTNIKMLSLVAFLLLAIAIINYTNLSTARSACRAKEVGMRKVVGAGKFQMVRQFMFEAMLMSTAALFVSLLLVHFLVPEFNNLTGSTVNIDYSGNLLYLSALVFLPLLAGTLAGIYPAFYLTSISPVKVFRGFHRSGGKGAGFRKWLVILQFSAAVCLIISTITIYRQIDYMKNRELGFSKEQNLVIHFKGLNDLREKYEMLKEVYLEMPGILGAAASHSIPGRGMHNYSFNLLDEPDGMNQSMYYLFSDADFVDLFGMEILAGRNFSKDIPTDIEESFLINQSGVKSIGLEKPEEAIGKKIQTGFGGRGYIIGVVADFNYRKLDYEIEPLIFSARSRSFRYLTLKVSTENLTGIIRDIESKWTELYPNKPFEYFFLDDDFNRQYLSDERMGTIFSAFTSMSIFIAALGLFGLSVFLVEQRVKEIGIRKVHGARIYDILVLLSSDIVRWIIIANIVAWPVTYYLMSEWLNGFAFRTSLSVALFVITGIGVVVVSLCTTGIQSLKAAYLNPVKTLRHE